LIFVNDYKEWELFGDVTFKIKSHAISLFLDYVFNTEADENETGYLVGFKVNKASIPGSWDFRFIGGGTDGKGHELNFGYQIGKGWKLSATYFMNEIGLDDGQDYDRVQIDLKFKF